jgi:hypothetical protein
MARIARKLLVGCLVLAIGGCGAVSEEQAAFSEAGEEVAASVSRLLVLDGIVIGTVSDVIEPVLVTPPIENDVGYSSVRKKKPQAKVAWTQDAWFTLGSGLSSSALQWIQSSLALEPARKQLALVKLDLNYNETSRFELNDAAITQIDFPGLDAASTAAVNIRLKVHAQATTLSSAPSGSPIQGQIRQKVKQLSAQRYRLDIAGIPTSDTARISRIAPFSVGLPDTSASAVPKQRVGNLRITLLEPYARGLRAWDASDRASGVNTTRTGTLQYLAGETALLTLTFQSLGGLQFTTTPATGITDVTLANGSVSAQF